MRFWSILGALVVGYREAVGLLMGGGMALVFGLIFAATGTGALYARVPIFDELNYRHRRSGWQAADGPTEFLR